MILHVQNTIPAIASSPILSVLEMDTRYIVGYIHSQGGKRARLYPAVPTVTSSYPQVP